MKNGSQKTNYLIIIALFPFLSLLYVFLEVGALLSFLPAYFLVAGTSSSPAQVL